jgi:hypothetical protein
VRELQEVYQISGAPGESSKKSSAGEKRGRAEEEERTARENAREREEGEGKHC